MEKDNVKVDVMKYSWQMVLNSNTLMHQKSRFRNEIEKKLQDLGVNYFYHVTSTIDEAKELIINLCKNGDRHFIIAGGDGTLNVFANAVMESGINSFEVFASLIPLGTGNDWGRSHGYSNHYLYAIDALVKGNFIRHDVGLVETVVDDKVIDSRYFVNIAGFGFDGAVIANANKVTTNVFRKQLYLINLLKTLLVYKSQPVTLIFDDSTVTKNILSIAVGIGQYNGNGMRQCPYAIPNDGLLDIVIVEKADILKVLANIQKLFLGTHVDKLKEVSMHRRNLVEISTKPSIIGEVEGEVLTIGDYYRIRCLPLAINFMQASVDKP